MFLNLPNNHCQVFLSFYIAFFLPLELCVHVCGRCETKDLLKF
jgi:hypothetical protein